MSNLNPDQFFHGTTHAIKDGVVRPADDADKDVSEHSFGDPGDMSEGDHAFAIRNNEHYAWHAAATFHSSLRRPRVYEVEPAPDMKPGPWNKEHPNFLAHHELDSDDPDYPPHPDDVAEAERNHQDEWASPTGFPVKRRIDIMPGRQGTFPQVSWDRFQTSGPRGGSGASHPSDSQVKYGMGLQQAPEAAHKEHAAVTEERAPAPKRRTGASLRAFMEGKPDPGPKPQPTLF